MLKTRVIPCLLLKNLGLVKTVGFKDPKYLGDPINIVKIFNDKEVDELVLLDISATTDGNKPQFSLIERIASECFMPLCYGGGVRSLDDMKILFGLGIEKVSMNSFALEKPTFIRAASGLFGNQSVIVSIDAERSGSGKYEVFTHSGRKATGLNPVELAVEMERQGAGELFVNSIDRDGSMRGYDIELIKMVSRAVNIPVVACGGAGKTQDLVDAVEKGGASAASAGSMFVFQGPHRAVLISYPSPIELRKAFKE